MLHPKMQLSGESPDYPEGEIRLAVNNNILHDLGDIAQILKALDIEAHKQNPAQVYIIKYTAMLIKHFDKLYNDVAVLKKLAEGKEGICPQKLSNYFGK